MTQQAREPPFPVRGHIRPLTALGKYSYAIYVFHQPLLVLMIEAGWLVWFRSVAGGLTAQLAAVSAVLSASFGAALISWHVCEKHFIRLKGLFPYGSGRTRDSAATRSPLGAAAP